ncbi:hypothetical protein OS493_034383 [Desmophyllum pertusum]|uniref:Uncharacterized protein n=1 Tax=Desmophyllum pertusum TaxID=174260 RepID=A0A9X0D8P3_9CNID|nr:hypothetical protein OS493_034383 [Desmophyllum pertusum]
MKVKKSRKSQEEEDSFIEEVEEEWDEDELDFDVPWLLMSFLLLLECIRIKFTEKIYERSWPEIRTSMNQKCLDKLKQYLQQSQGLKSPSLNQFSSDNGLWIHHDEVEDNDEVILIWDFQILETNLSITSASSLVRPKVPKEQGATRGLQNLTLSEKRQDEESQEEEFIEEVEEEWDEDGSDFDVPWLVMTNEKFIFANNFDSKGITKIDLDEVESHFSKSESLMAAIKKVISEERKRRHYLQQLKNKKITDIKLKVKK